MVADTTLSGLALPKDFVRISEIRTERPTNAYFVTARVSSFFNRGIRVTFPFSKFFLEEGKAKQAEKLYRQQNITGKQDSYAIVRVGSNGHAVIQDLVLGGIPVTEALR